MSRHKHSFKNITLSNDELRKLQKYGAITIPDIKCNLKIRDVDRRLIIYGDVNEIAKKIKI
jgi:hypothetical protein